MHPTRYPPRFLPYDQLKQFVPFTRQHLSRLEKAGLFQSACRSARTALRGARTSPANGPSAARVNGQPDP